MGGWEFLIGVVVGGWIMYAILYHNVLWLLKVRIDGQNSEEGYVKRENYTFSEKLKRVIR